MSFTASGAGLAFAAIGILVGFLAVAGLAYESGVDDHPGRIIIRDVCALYVIANVVVYSMTALPPRSESETRAATIAEISSHFGLESGKEYPLQLGERFAGTSGDMRVVGALFYTYGSGSWNPATGLSIGFSAEDGRSYILEIPTAKVTFVQSETAEPSVKLDMGVSGLTSVMLVCSFIARCQAVRLLSMPDGGLVIETLCRRRKTMRFPTILIGRGLLQS